MDRTVNSKPRSISPQRNHLAIDDEMISPAVAGQLIGGEGRPLSTKTLANWRVLGFGPPFYKIGRLITYGKRSTLAWMATRQHQCTSTYTTAGTATTSAERDESEGRPENKNVAALTDPSGVPCARPRKCGRSREAGS